MRVDVRPDLQQCFELFVPENVRRLTGSDCHQVLLRLRGLIWRQPVCDTRERFSSSERQSIAMRITDVDAEEPRKPSRSVLGVWEDGNK